MVGNPLWRKISENGGSTPHGGTKHLLTLQEGVSENQFREMTEARFQLVVTKDLHNAYPKAVRANIVILEALSGIFGFLIKLKIENDG